jgi:hypothetical protein
MIGYVCEQEPTHRYMFNIICKDIVNIYIYI